MFSIYKIWYEISMQLNEQKNRFTEMKCNYRLIFCLFGLWQYCCRFCNMARSSRAIVESNGQITMFVWKNLKCAVRNFRSSVYFMFWNLWIIHFIIYQPYEMHLLVRIIISYILVAFGEFLLLNYLSGREGFPQCHLAIY